MTRRTLASMLLLSLTPACATVQPMTPTRAVPPIVQTGAQVLRAPAQAVPPERIATPEFQSLLATMFETMRAAPGVGLAAPQIGVPWQVLVLEDPEALFSTLSGAELAERERVAVAPRVFINPKLTPIDDEKVTFFEGCLSVSGFAGLVERWREVEVSGLDEHGAMQRWRVKGWPARILQHEVDHLNGTLYIDRMVTRSFSTLAQVKARFAGKSMTEVRALLGLGP